MTHTLEWHAEQLQAAFAARRYALARWHCRMFTGIARARAKTLFNDGSGWPTGQHIPSHVGTPSPYQEKDAPAGASKG